MLDYQIYTNYRYKNIMCRSGYIHIGVGIYQYMLCFINAVLYDEPFGFV